MKLRFLASLWPVSKIMHMCFMCILGDVGSWWQSRKTLISLPPMNIPKLQPMWNNSFFDDPRTSRTTLLLIQLMIQRKKKTTPRCVGGEDKWSSQHPHPRGAHKRTGISQTQRSSLRNEGFKSHIWYPSPGNQYWKAESP